MTRTIAYVTLLLAIAIVIVCAMAAPTILGDSNKFMEGFIGHEFLLVLGVILTITLASTAQIHLEFNKIEERFRKRNALLRARQGVRTAAFFLIFLFLLAILLVVTKPMLAHAPWSETLFNGAGLVIIIWNVLILIELTLTIFGITPFIDED